MSLLQVTIEVGDVAVSPGVGNGGGLVAILIAILAIVAAILAVHMVRIFHIKRIRAQGGTMENIVLRIQIPRFTRETEQKELDLKELQEDIAVAETFFSSIGGLPAERGFSAWWNGRSDHVSFEIVAQRGVIYFYVATPQRMVEHVVQQLQAQFPKAEITRIEDYNIFSPTGVTLGSYVTFKRQNLFPIKTYRQLESDPLNALLNALSKVPEDQGAAVQFTIRSARAKWRKPGLNVVQRMSEGATLKEALKGRSPRKQSMASVALGNSKQAEAQPKEPRKLTQREEEMVKAISEKAARAGMDVNIRVIVSASSIGVAQTTLNNMLNSFSQYNVYQFGNSFQKVVPRNPKQLISDFIYRNFTPRRSIVLATEEMASMWHPPLPGTPTMNIDWLESRKGAAPASLPKTGLLLGKNEYRGGSTDIYMQTEDRQRHMYLIGKSGSGKTTLIRNLVIQDIQAGHGVGVVDPHGDLIADLLGMIPKERIKDVIVFSPYDRDMPIGLNMLEAPNQDLRDFAVQEMISIFYKLFPPEMIGPMFEHNMRNVMLTLMSDPDQPGTIAEIPRMFSDEAFQKQWVAKVKDPVVRAFWEQEMAKTSDFHKSEMLGYLISKVGRFVEDEMMRNIIGQQRSGFSIREVMDNQKILFLDLSKGKTGEVNSQLLGLIIVTKLQMAAMARADLPEEQRKDFYLYIDEFQNFVTPSIATILSEARKYRLNLILAHQYMSQVVEKGDTEIRDAILGNVGSMFVSRIGPEDVETFEKIFAPAFNGTDLINSDKYTWYVKMILNNSQLPPFTMKAQPPEETDPALAEKIRQLARVTYGRPRAEVEADIAKRSQIGAIQRPAQPPENA